MIKVGFLCPYCDEETDTTKDAFLVRIYAASKSNKSFDANPEGILNSWSCHHRKTQHPESPAYPGGLKFKNRKVDPVTGKVYKEGTIVNKSNCQQFYQNFEFTVKKWSEINGLKRKQTAEFKKTKLEVPTHLPEQVERKSVLKEPEKEYIKRVQKPKEKAVLEQTEITESRRESKPVGLLPLSPEQNRKQGNIFQDFQKQIIESETKTPPRRSKHSSPSKKVRSQAKEKDRFAEEVIYNPVPPMSREEINFLITEIQKSIQNSEDYLQHKKFLKTYEKKLHRVETRMGQLLTGEEERLHLAKFRRPLSDEDIRMFSSLRWSEAKDVGDLIKLVPTAYFDDIENEEFGFFKLRCYEGVSESPTFSRYGMKVNSKRLLKLTNFANNKTLRNAFTTFKSRLKQKLWAKNSDFFEHFETFRSEEKNRKTESSREDSVLRFKCLSVLKHVLENRSYASFEREMYYLHYTGVDVGTVDHSTYFVEKVIETLSTLLRKVILDDFCKFDEVTQSYPDFSLAADGLTDQEKSGETVMLTKFCGGRIVNFPVHLKKHKRSRGLGPDSYGLLRHFELAFGSAGVDGEIRLFENLVSSVLDGAEQFKVEYPLMEKILLQDQDYDDEFSRRSELPEANIVEWCKAHSWELVAKDMIKLDPIVKSLESTVKALRRFLLLVREEML